MRHSYWLRDSVSTGEVYSLLTFTKRTPYSLDDHLLAHKIGELDPFASGMECSDEMQFVVPQDSLLEKTG